MSLEYPETFGEAYFASQVLADKQFADDTEKSLQPFIAGLLALVSGKEGMPPAIEQMLGSFATPGNFGLAEVGKAIAGQAGSGVIQQGLAPLMTALTYAVNSAAPTKLIELDTAATLRYRKIMPDDLFHTIGTKFGFPEAMSDALYRSLQPYPEITDVIQWARYTYGDNDVYAHVADKLDMVEDDLPLWDFATRLRLTTTDIQQMYARKTLTFQQASEELRRLGYYDEAIAPTLDLSYGIPNPTILLQSSLFRGESFDVNERYVELAGVHPDYVPHYIDGVLDKPDATTLIRYALRNDPNLSTLERELRRIGIHPDYFHIYKELAYPIPPIADLITMAVREAFSPDIASRFGQYEDYPDELSKFAAMDGLSEDWAKRYWAAHWSLPSPTQGFEMLHRGIIDERELNMLLRALDIMPYWRDKLIQISYNPLTRVDVRRMYSLGVLSENEVTKAYQDAGYSRENAESLREFTVKQTTSSQSGLSVTKIVTAYKSGIMQRNDAYNAILRLGVRSSTVGDILESADIQREWQRTKDAISSIKNRYKQEVISESVARQELGRLRLDSIKIDSYIDQWTIDGTVKLDTLLTKADVLSLVKKNLITSQRAREEFRLLGYTDERAGLLLATIAEN